MPFKKVFSKKTLNQIIADSYIKWLMLKVERKERNNMACKCKKKKKKSKRSGY